MFSIFSSDNIKTPRAVWAAVTMATMLALLAVVWGMRRPAMLAARYAEQLPDVPDALVERHLQRTMELGDAGLPVVVAALAAERPAAREAARRVLLDEVDHWELLPRGESADKLTLLAHQLAAIAPRLHGEDRRFAADLASRLMEWPRPATGAEGDPLLADCETVLDTIARGGGRTPSELAEGNSDAERATELRADVARLHPDVSMAEAISVPGGDLPIDAAPMPPSEWAQSGGSQRDGVAAAEPNRLPKPLPSRPLQPNPSDSRPDDSAADSAAANQPRQLPGAEGEVKPASGKGDSADAAALKKMPARDVMRRLHVKDPHVVAAAQLELEHRGISGREIELARRATDPDPQVRRAFAKSLPSMSGVDAKPWLLELSYDADAQVRGTAVALMATSGDMDLLRRVEEIARDDPDDHIRQQAERASQPVPRN